MNFVYIWEVAENVYINQTKFKFDVFFDYLGLIFLYGLDLAACVVLTLFFKFHIKLVLENKTTIETIDKKNEDFSSPYTLSKWENVIQVMGENIFLWFVPIKSYAGQPVGNGIDWTVK